MWTTHPILDLVPSSFCGYFIFQYEDIHAYLLLIEVRQHPKIDIRDAPGRLLLIRREAILDCPTSLSCALRKKKAKMITSQSLCRDAPSGHGSHAQRDGGYKIPLRRETVCVKLWRLPLRDKRFVSSRQADVIGQYSPTPTRSNDYSGTYCLPSRQPFSSHRDESC